MDADVNSCTQLWCAVVMQAFDDATTNSKSSALDRTQARTWLTTPSKDFNDVCRFAGFEPEDIRSRALKLIAEADNGIPKAQRGRVLTHNGESLTILEWCERLGIDRGTIHARLRQGLPLDRVLAKKKIKAAACVPATRRIAGPSFAAAQRQRVARRSFEANAISAKRKKGRAPKTITFGGRSLTLQQWGDETGLSYFVIDRRLKNGWSVDEALSTPAGKRGVPAVRLTGGGSELSPIARDRRGSVAQDSV